MIHHSLLLLALTFLPLFTFAQERIEVNDPEIKFSYILPNGWEVKDDGYDYEIHHPEIKDAFISFAHLEQAQGSGNLESLGSKPSFDDNFDFEIRYMLPEVFGTIEVFKQGKAQIDGASGRWIRFHSGKNEELISIFYMYPKLKHTFKINGTAPATDFENVKSYFESFIKSLTSSEV